MPLSPRRVRTADNLSVRGNALENSILISRQRVA